jgi:NADH dehydrogenase
MSMKTIPQALNIRSFILENFEQAVLTTDVDQNSLINFVLVGGGPTGVELAGALAEMNHPSKKIIPDLDISKMQINLIQSGDRMNTMSEKSHCYRAIYRSRLKSGKKCVLLIMMVILITTNSDLVLIPQGIWTAGVQGAVVAGLNADALVEKSRTHTRKTNSSQVKGYQDIFNW